MSWEFLFVCPPDAFWSSVSADQGMFFFNMVSSPSKTIVDLLFVISVFFKEPIHFCTVSNPQIMNILPITIFSSHAVCYFAVWLSWVIYVLKAKCRKQQNSTDFRGITAHERGLGATPLVPKAKAQRMEPTCLVWMQNTTPLHPPIHPDSSSPPCPSPPVGPSMATPTVSAGLTVVGLRRSLTWRLTGYHGVGHGCGQFTQ